LVSRFGHNGHGDAVADDLAADNDDALSRLEQKIRDMEGQYEALIAKLSSPTEEMMLAGALAHNAGLRPIRASITASDAKKIFSAMIAVLKESLPPSV
jgi:hypothetical protein